MSIWGAGPFESDDAVDWSRELDEEPSLDALEEAFAAVLALEPGEYIEVDVGGAAFAAAETLARVLETGGPSPLKKKTVAALRRALEKLPMACREALLARAVAALRRVAEGGGRSELRDGWTEGKLSPRPVQDLQKRIARLHVAHGIGLGKRRPASVPKGAVFDKKDGEWALEPRDARGRRHGRAEYFRPDGTLREQRSYNAGGRDVPYVRFHESGEVSRRGTIVAGKLHGTDVFFRSKQPTSEPFFKHLSDIVVRWEADFRAGTCVASRWFDRRGRPVTPAGDPAPVRPAAVPESAVFNGPEGWVEGAGDENNQRHGRWRFWDAGGRRPRQIVYEHGVAKRKR